MNVSAHLMCKKNLCFFLLKSKTDVKYTQKKRKRETNICLFIYWGALQRRKKTEHGTL